MEASGAKIRAAAMNLLARREYCRAELQEKLTRRFAAPDKIEQELQRLQEEGLQSDRRFVEAFVNGRVARLQGELKIRQELGRFKLETPLVDQVFADLDVSWREMALEAVQRKFSSIVPADTKQRDRARQFLYRRGFSSDDCVWAVEQITGGESNPAD